MNRHMSFDGLQQYAQNNRQLQNEIVVHENEQQNVQANVRENLHRLDQQNAEAMEQNEQQQVNPQLLLQLGGQVNLAPINHNENQLGNFLESGVSVPSRAINKELNLAIRRILDWKSFKQNTSLPVRNAAEELLNAKNGQEVKNAIGRIIDSSMNYMRINAGSRSVFGSGEKRKEDVRSLIKEVCNYAANSSEQVIYAVGLKIDALDAGFKYTGVIKSAFGKAIEDVYGNGTTLLDARRRALAETEEKTRIIKSWGGIEERARMLLDAREDKPREWIGNGAVELNAFLDEFRIPDIKNMDDYELLSFPALDEYRSKVYVPVMQNIEYLIATGELEDKSQILTLKSKVSLMGKELDLYDARIRVIAGCAKEGDEAIISNSRYKDDLEKEVRENALFDMDHALLLVNYKKLYKTFKPGTVFNKQNLDEREKIIEANKAKKEVLLGARKYKADNRIVPSKLREPEYVLKHFKAEADRILNTDVSILFNMEFTENGLFKGAASRLELLDMLTGIDGLINWVNDNEALVDKDRLYELIAAGEAITDSEKKALGLLSELGKKVSKYYEMTTELYSETEGSDLIAMSEYEALSEDEKKTLLSEPRDTRQNTPGSRKVRSLCSKFNDIITLRNELSSDIGVYAANYEKRKTGIVSEKQKIDEDYKKLLDEKLRQQAKADYDNLVKLALDEAKKEKHIDAPQKQLDEKKVEELIEKNKLDDEARERAAKEAEKKKTLELLKNTTRLATAAYSDLGKRNKTFEDAQNVRALCVNTISQLTDIVTFRFDQMETFAIVELLEEIQGADEYDKEAFKEEVSKALEEVPDTDGLVSDIIILRKKKVSNQRNELDLRDKSIRTIDAALSRYVRSRKSLDKYDTNLLAELATLLVSVKDIKVAPKYSDDESGVTAEQEGTFRRVACKALSLISERPEDDFAKIDVLRLDEIFHEAFNRLGSEKDDEKSYLEVQLAIEERRSIIRDALSAYNRFDFKTGTSKEIMSIRDKMTDSLVKLTGCTGAELDFIKTSELSKLLNDAEKNIENAQLIKEEAIKKIKEFSCVHTAQNYEEEFLGISSSGDLSESYKVFLKKELSADIYNKLLSKGYSLKDFEKADADNLANATFMAAKLRERDKKEDFDENKKALLKESMAYFSVLTGVEAGFLEKLPEFEFINMANRIIEDVLDPDIFKETKNDYQDYHRVRFISGDFFKDCQKLLKLDSKGEAIKSGDIDNLLNINKKGYLENFEKNSDVKPLETKKEYEQATKEDIDKVKELCIYYLKEVVKVPDLKEEDLKETKALVLYQMALKQHEAKNDKLTLYNPNEDELYIALNDKLEKRSQDFDAVTKSYENSKAVLEEENKKYQNQLNKYDSQNNKKNLTEIEKLSGLLAINNNKMQYLEQQKEVYEECVKTYKMAIEEHVEKKTLEHQSSALKACIQIEENFAYKNDPLTEYGNSLNTLLLREFSEKFHSPNGQEISTDSYYDWLKETKEQVKEWDEDTKKTLDMLGDIVSSEKFYYQDGKEMAGPDRLRHILSKNAKALGKTLNGLLSGKKDTPLDNINTYVSGAEGELLSKIAGALFNRLSDILKTSHDVTGSLSDAQIMNFISDKLTDNDLKILSIEIEKAEVAGEATLNALIEQAATDLFGVKGEEIEPLFDDVEDVNKYKEVNKIEASNKNEQVSKIEASDKNKQVNKAELSGKNASVKNLSQAKEEKPKSKAELDKEVLQNLRDAAFDTRKGQGRFLYLVIRDYYKQAPVELKRSMLSYLIKDVKPTVLSTSINGKGASFFASILKGAGPIMQKLFQGIPEHMLTDAFRPALSVVKSNLSPISPEYVDKKIEQITQTANNALIKKGSKNYIREIKKVKSLGAASIAETYLCDVTYETGKKEQVVIKLLRPTVTLKTLQGEKDFIEKCAIDTDNSGVMKATFNAHYNKIMEELNFGNEFKNASLGKVAYNAVGAENGAKVKAVNVSEIIPSGVDYLVMDKAEGITADRYIEQLSEYSKKVLEQFQNYDPATQKLYTLKPGEESKRLQVRKEIIAKLREAEKCQLNMEILVETWIRRALFDSTGSAGCFHHGDLHAGNIMISKDQATVLDFGNCSVMESSSKFTKLLFSSNRLNEIIKIMAAAFIGDTSGFVKAVENIIATDKQNPYNKLTDSKKAEVKQKLFNEIDKILQLGEPGKTGERIFVALLKTQELGVILPQEIQNFSQCQQRLENSLNEFIGAIDGLLKSLDIIDTMPVLYKQGSDYIDPEKFLYRQISLGKNTSDSNTKSLWHYRHNFERLTKDSVLNHLSENDGGIEFFKNHYVNEYLKFKESVDNTKTTEKNTESNKAFYEKLQSDVSRWKAGFADYKRFLGKKEEDITDPGERTLFHSVRNIGIEIAAAASRLEYDSTTSIVIGRKLAVLANKVTHGSQEAFDLFIKKVAVDLPNAYKFAAKYEQYVSTSKDKDRAKLRDGLAESFLAVQNNFVRNGELIRNLQNVASPDLIADNYFNPSEINTIIMDIYADLEKANERRSLFKEGEGSTKESPKYVYGDMARKLLEYIKEYEEVSKSNAFKNPAEKEKKRADLRAKIAHEYTYLNITRKSAENRRILEDELGKYLQENSLSGKMFFSKYLQAQTMKERYIKCKYEKAGVQELQKVQADRIKYENEFLNAFMDIGRSHIIDIVKSYNSYGSMPKYNFVEIMSNVLNSKSTDVMCILGKDSTKYKKRIEEMMKPKSSAS